MEQEMGGRWQGERADTLAAEPDRHPSEGSTARGAVAKFAGHQTAKRRGGTVLGALGQDAGTNL